MILLDTHILIWLLIAPENLAPKAKKVICGGILLPVSSLGNKMAITVPMAFQSAMAGIMLAGEIILFSMGKSSSPPPATTKINLLKSLGRLLSEPESKHYSGRCICQDQDFIDAYQKKFDCVDEGASLRA
jgi:hypothetical protein